MAGKDLQLNKEPYKGVRDFYPRDKALQNFIFSKWRKVAESYGYEEMDASPLEPTELFEAKTGEEIINEQTYTFTDRGDRRVTLRPEMTPTVARMIAQKKRELNFPVRWYSIANFFRYERPQKGRLREFFQMNCDLFGASGADADMEIISMAYSIMKTFGAKDENFELRINNRKFVNFILRDYFSLDDKSAYKLTKVIDKKNKINQTEFLELARIILGNKTKDLVSILSAKNLKDISLIDKSFSKNEGFKEMEVLFSKLENFGIKNYRFEPTLTRGLDYYTGIVFEVFDTGGENNRSMFGGGRYDNLLEIFGEEPVPTIGFAVGDVTMVDYLETYKLIPEYISTTELFIVTLDEKFIEEAQRIAQKLREGGVNVALNLSSKKIGDQISIANKKSIPFVLFVGSDEVTSGKFKVKNLNSGEETSLDIEGVISYLRK
jgi:histidyl-tRNA synthetase